MDKQPLQITALDNSVKAAAIDILARTIWGEARGESIRGMEAIACSIINRERISRQHGGHWWGNNIVEICLKPQQYSCWNATDANRQELLLVAREDSIFKICLRIARRALHGGQPDPSKGATHYHNLSCHPWWARAKRPCSFIGNHLFYKNVG